MLEPKHHLFARCLILVRLMALLRLGIFLFFTFFFFYLAHTLCHFRLFISFIFIATSWPVGHLERDVCTFRCFCWIIFRHTSKCIYHRYSVLGSNSGEQWTNDERFYRIILLQIIYGCGHVLTSIYLRPPRAPHPLT